MSLQFLLAVTLFVGKPTLKSLPLPQPQPVATATEMQGRLAARGPIPADFRGDPSSQIPALAARSGKELGFFEGLQSSSENRDWRDFWGRQLSNRRDLALNGWALFGDPMSAYLEKVKDSVLSSEPELRKRIRVYACPSPYVNAMMLPDGLALVNLGMMARLADESQLAFVLAHEAAHFALRHSEDAWWEGRESDGSGADRWEKTRFQHSRVREAQADSLGLKFLRASRYSTEGVDSLFGVLDGSDNAFGDRPWTKNALADFPNLRVPDSYWLDPSKVRLAPPETAESDSIATHPAIPRRRAAAKRILGDPPGNGEKWIVDRRSFTDVRKAAMHGVPRGWLEADQPAVALFEAWNLLKDNASDSELKDVFRRALIDLAMERGAQRRLAPRALRLRVWGAYQTLDHFIQSIDSPRLFALGMFATQSKGLRASNDSLYALGSKPNSRSKWRNRFHATWSISGIHLISLEV